MNILDEANKLTSRDRHDDYGHPYHDFNRTAQLWTALLGVPVTARQVGLCMIAVKLSRQVNKGKRDNLVDIAGYARTVEMVDEFERDNPEQNHEPRKIQSPQTAAQSHGTDNRSFLPRFKTTD